MRLLFLTLGHRHYGYIDYEVELRNITSPMFGMRATGRESGGKTLEFLLSVDEERE
jgi:hypothetical protein